MKKHLIYIVCLFNGFAWAQIQQGEATVTRDTDFKEESVVVERVYEPKVEAAEKIKQTPKIEESKKNKLPVSYGLKDVEAESDFETSTLNADELPVRNAHAYNNYVRGGFGNRYTFLADGYAEFDLDESKTAGASIDYYSSAAKIKNTYTDTDELKLNAEGFLKLNFDNASSDLRLGGFLHQLNYYGIETSVREFLTIKDVEQAYKNIYVAGKYNAFNHIFLDNIKVKANFFSDKHDASESTFDLSSVLKNQEIIETNILNGMTLGAKAAINLNVSKTDFEIFSDSSYRTFNTGIIPQITLANAAFQLNLGANIQYLNTDIQSQYASLGAASSKVHLFPTADFSLNAIPEFGVYGGITGGFSHNRYQTLYNNNPYLLPQQDLLPTKNKLEVYAGIRGDIGQNFKYDAMAKFHQLENIPFFSRLNKFGHPYAQANAFTTMYDDGDKTTIEGTLNYTGFSHLDLGTTLTLQSYKLDHMQEAWNKPAIKASIDAHYKLLNDQLVLGGNLFFVGKRDATYSDFITLDKANTNLLPAKSLDAYVDLNLNATYMFLKRWGAFLELRNILNNSYERYLDYEVQGATGIGGVLFKF